MKYAQGLIALAVLCAAATQCYYLLGIGRGTTNMQPLTAALYILFFWVLWGYARISNFIAPLFSLDKRAVKFLAVAVVLVPLLMALLIGSSSDTAHVAMMKFGVLNAVLMAGYLLIALVALFGDRWLGPIARLLKFGRNFPEKRA